MSSDQFREKMAMGLREAFPGDFDSSHWKDFALLLHYVPVRYNDQKSYEKSLRETLLQLEKEYQTGGYRIFYLALPPSLYESVILHLGSITLSQQGGGHTHLVIEKPFGRDLNSARRLNQVLKHSFQESEVFRIDHYSRPGDGPEYPDAPFCKCHLRTRVEPDGLSTTSKLRSLKP